MIQHYETWGYCSSQIIYGKCLKYMLINHADNMYVTSLTTFTLGLITDDHVTKTSANELPPNINSMLVVKRCL